MLPNRQRWWQNNGVRKDQVFDAMELSRVALFCPLPPERVATIHDHDELSGQRSRGPYSKTPTVAVAASCRNRLAVSHSLPYNCELSLRFDTNQGILFATTAIL